jgi:hypothetical protein
MRKSRFADEQIDLPGFGRAWRIPELRGVSAARARSVGAQSAYLMESAKLRGVRLLKLAACSMSAFRHAAVARR